MQAGYLTLETREDRPGYVRLVRSDNRPLTEARDDGARIRVIGRYSDIEAAAMHVHNHLRRHLVDIDQHLYEAPLSEAMAAMHTLSLTSSIEWIDPDIDRETLDAMQACLDNHKSGRRMRDRWIQLLILIAIALLVFNLISGFLGGPTGLWF